MTAEACLISMYKWLDSRSSCFQLATSTSPIKHDHVGCLVSQQICKHIMSSSSLGQTLYTTLGLLFAHCLLLITLTITLQTLCLPPVLLNPYCTHLSPSCCFRLKLVQDLAPPSITFQGWLQHTNSIRQHSKKYSAAADDTCSQSCCSSCSRVLSRWGGALGCCAMAALSRVVTTI